MPAQNHPKFPIMRFSQLDSFSELVPGVSIRASRLVTGREDYLRDHFPLFAVLPGVLMLESLYQASCWLIYDMLQYKSGLLYMAEARNVKFADFVGPNETLEIACELVKRDGDRFLMKCQGTKGDVVAVSARLVIAPSVSDAAGDPQSLHDTFLSVAKREQFEEMFPKS